MTDTTPQGLLGLDAQEVASYSLLRILRAQWEYREKGTDPAKIAPLEYALSQQLSDKLDNPGRGCLVPLDVLVHQRWSREASYRAPPADTVENASLVPEDTLASQWIEALQNQSVVMAAGATVLPGLRGDVSIPRVTQPIPVQWLGEDESGTDQDLNTDAVTLKPTTISSHVPITRRLLKQSTPAADMLVREEIARSIASGIDAAALGGDGTNNVPLGVINQPDILTASVADVGNSPTFPEALSFEGELDGANQLAANASWVATPAIRSSMRAESKDTGSGMFLWDDSNAVIGYTGRSTSNMPAGNVVLGVWSNLLIGNWGGLDLLMDNITKAAAGGLHVRAFQDLDIAVRRGNAFCKAA